MSRHNPSLSRTFASRNPSNVSEHRAGAFWAIHRRRPTRGDVNTFDAAQGYGSDGPPHDPGDSAGVDGLHARRGRGAAATRTNGRAGPDVHADRYSATCRSNAITGGEHLGAVAGTKTSGRVSQGGLPDPACTPGAIG